MGLTRNLFDDVKTGASFATREVLTSAQMSAVFAGLRQIESAMYRAALSQWTAIQDSSVDASPDIFVFDANLGLWVGAVDGTAGTMKVFTSHSADWASKSTTGGLVSGYTQECGASNGSGKILFGGGSASTSTDERIVETTDGNTFTKRAIGATSTDKVTQMVWDPIAELFIVGFGGNGGAIYTSADGTTWTAKTPPGALSGVQFIDAASNEEAGDANMVILTAQSGNYAYARQSDNFTSWTAATFPASGSYRISYAKGQGKWIAADSTNAYVSDDGLTWTAVTLPTLTALRDVAGIGDLLVLLHSGDVVGSGDTLSYSNDAGATWTKSVILPSVTSRGWGFSDRQALWVNGDTSPHTAYFSLPL